MTIAPLPEPIHPVALALVAFAPPALLWVGLAARQAWRSDPDRARRRGQRALQRLTLRCHGRVPSRLELETWRELCVQTWGLSESVPRTAAWTAGLPAEAEPALWARLWTEAEQALYAAQSDLPADWPARAAERAGALPPWPAMPWLPTQRTHWFPHRWSALSSTRLALLLVLCATTVPTFAAKPPTSDRETSQQAVARQPGDWAAHDRLAAGYAHEEQWGWAAGHWIAAYLLNPQPATVRSGFRLGLQKIEGVDPRLIQLAKGQGIAAFAGWLSPARWQEVLVLGACLSALGWGTLVVSRYVVRRRAYGWTGVGLVICSATAVTAAILALRLYGPLGNPRAAVVIHRAEVRSIPSDLVAKESATTLPAGAVVLVIRSFFGWDQVVLDGGTVGWARTESLLWIYRHRDDAVPARELP